MKPLTKHLKQLRARNRFRQWTDIAVEGACIDVLFESYKRWNALQAELKLQRCKLFASIPIRDYWIKL